MLIALPNYKSSLVSDALQRDVATDSTQSPKESAIEEFFANNASIVMVSVLVVAIVVTLVVTLLYFVVFLWGPLSVAPERLGQAGDYFGGLLNPALSFLSVFALLVTLVLQNRELRLSRDALKVSQRELELSREAQADSASALAEQNRAIQQQRLEQTLFSWIQSYKTLLQQIETPTLEIPQGGPNSIFGLGSPPAIHTGVSALRQFYMRYLTDKGVQIHFMGMISDDDWASECAKYVPAGTILLRPDKTLAPNILRKCLIPADAFVRFLFDFKKRNGPSLVIKAAQNGWYNLYSAEGHQLEPVFRALHRLIEWIDEQPEMCAEISTKLRYARMIQSHLSKYELALLFYFGLSNEGAHFKPLIEKYALFDSLGLAHARGDLHFLVQYENPDGQPYAPTAFNRQAGTESAAAFPATSG